MIGKSTSSRVFDIVNYMLMITLSVAFVAPLWHILMSSVSDPRQLMASTGLLIYPLGDITLEGYRMVLRNPSIITGYVNTLIYVSGTTALGTILTILAGFVISRKNLKLKIHFIIFIVITMFFSGGLIPTYMLIRELGFVGTRWAILIPGVTNGFFIMVMRSAFMQLPDSFEESAKIDGAGPLLIMARILVPLVKSTIAVVIIFTVVLQWNSWFPASIYLPLNRELWPLQLVMREILVQNEVSQFISGSEAEQMADMSRELVRYATVIVGTLPVLCIYPFLQKYFVKGVTLGGVKG